MRQERTTSSRRRATAVPSAKAIFTFLLAQSAAALSPIDSVSGAVDPSRPPTTKRTQCLVSRSLELASLAACGDKGSLNYCFSNPKPRGEDGLFVERAAADLEICFTNAGCTAEEAAIEAEWTVRRCDERGSSPDMSDLRKRQNDDDDATTTAKTTSKPKTTSAKTTSAKPQTTSEIETTDAPVTTTVPPTTSETTPSGTTQQATTSPTGTTTGPLVCHTPTITSINSCPIQSTGTGSGKETLPCFPTTTTKLVCAEGLRCMVDDVGLPTCMRLQNNLTTSGVIVSIAFGAFAFVAFVATLFFCCRDRSAQRKLMRAAEAAAIARDAKAAALGTKKRPSVQVRSVSATSDSQPLMPPAAPQGYSDAPANSNSYLGGGDFGGAAPQQQGYGQQSGYGQQQDPFVDHPYSGQPPRM